MSLLTSSCIDRAVVSVRVHRASDIDESALSRLYPPLVALALAMAAASRDIDAIDAITDNTLCKDGLARRRDDSSELESLRSDLVQRYGSRT